MENFFDEQRVVEHPDISLANGAIRGWDRRNPYYYSMLSAVAKRFGFSLDKPFSSLPKRARQAVLYGSKQPLVFEFAQRGGEAKRKVAPFEGIINNLHRRWLESDSPQVRETLGQYVSTRRCQTCGGARLSRDSLAVRVGGVNVHEIASLPLDALDRFFDTLNLGAKDGKIADRVIREIRSRTGFLVGIGLSYLSLGRAANTLSGGESQRIRLASQIGSGLTGVTYVLDEPSIGLHQHDNGRLLETLRRLRDLNNTVLVIEHDEEAIRAADYVIDVGPGAGAHGGRVVAAGTPKKVAASRTLTGKYLSGALRIETPKRRRRAKGHLVVHEAAGNNLKGDDFAFPLGVITCVTGVSGSGKSTLVRDILVRAGMRHLHHSAEEPLAHKSVSGWEHVDKIIIVDQSPIGRTPRSNPATYTGMFTAIRDCFAQLPMARERGYGGGRFSFNVAGGRCEACEGDGVMRIAMHFLPDVFVTCETCGGKRYNRETLEVRYRDKNIAEVLEMTVDEAAEFFRNIPPVYRRLQTLQAVGLGYVALGQTATTLSGGEAQRVKLSLELSKRQTGRTLFVLDEPTTGLHFHDVSQLLTVLQQLAEHGNTIVIIEHNLDVIKTADWILDLGPGGGDGGGRLIAAGTPEALARKKNSLTGRYLAPLLKRTRRAAG